MFRVGNATLVLTLVFVLCIGGLVHALIPHDDGDNHSSTEIVWGTLHSAMQHEQKFLVFALIDIFLISLLIAGIYSIALHVPVGIEAMDKRHRQLRRGIAKYRKFR